MPDLNLREPEFLRSLERLSLVSRRAYAGLLKGEKKSTRRGTSIEFADYRDYVPGDDLRYLDWNAYGRLDKLLLKLFVEEEESAGLPAGRPQHLDGFRRTTEVRLRSATRRGVGLHRAGGT